MTAVNTEHLWAGFADPLQQAQQTFRAILKALSEPGEVRTLDATDTDGTIEPATWSVLMTLTDQDTPVWISPMLDRDSVRDNLRFHCGAPVAAQAGEASFAVLAAEEWIGLEPFAGGDDENPHQSATLIIQVASLSEGPGYRLSGPGIRDNRDVRIDGLSDLHLRLLSANRERFPAGIDLILVSGRQILGLARTTRLEAL